MLSRIAESLYWIGRYVERADGTARIVDVLRLQLLEDPGTNEAEICNLVYSGIMGQPYQSGLTFAAVGEGLVLEPHNHSSITGSLGSARENARRARETLSTELWEAINTSWHRWRTLGSAAVTGRHLDWMRERSALINGIADSTMSHDEAWEFLTLGRSLERADMTARMVAAGANEQGAPGWWVILSGCGAQQSFLRSQRGLVSDAAVAAFLVLDRRFPRSVLASLAAAEQRLQILTPDDDRIGFSDEARRILGRARTELEYRSPDSVLEDLSGVMRGVQESVVLAGQAISHRYFENAPVDTWTGGSL